MLSALHFLFYVTLKHSINRYQYHFYFPDEETEGYRAYYKWNSEPFIGKAEIIAQVL